eukprot:g23148.t1
MVGTLTHQKARNSVLRGVSVGRTLLVEIEQAKDPCDNSRDMANGDLSAASRAGSFVWCALLLLCWPAALAWRSGAPICSTSKLNVIQGCGTSPNFNNTAGPWKILASSPTFLPGQQITVTLTGGVQLRGFTLQAQTAADYNSNRPGLGAFSANSLVRFGTENSGYCRNQPWFTTHSASFNVRDSISLTWTAPSDYPMEPVAFSAIAYQKRPDAAGTFFLVTPLVLMPERNVDSCLEGPLLPCPWHASCTDVPHAEPLSLEGRICSCNDPLYPPTGSRDCCALPANPCNDDEFRCNNGKCIKTLFLCSNSDECGDNSEEKNCVAPCPPGTFECANGRCVSEGLKCSFSNECGDGSDEWGCSAQPCPDNTFQCRDGGALGGPVCIPQWKVCDFNRDCMDESDESHCLAPAGQCEPYLIDCGFSGQDSAVLGAMMGIGLSSGLTWCVSRAAHCNGENECILYSTDEQNCVDTCVPNCALRQCGEDDCCGGKCSGSFLDHTCPPEAPLCSADGQCTCRPACKGKPCGATDGCGGTCHGTCPDLQECVFPQHFCAPVFRAYSTDVPKEMGTDGLQQIMSELEVDASGIVLDVDVLDLTGNHSWYGDLRMTLESPTGTVVEIVKRVCPAKGEGVFYLTLDDDAQQLEPDCPPTSPGKRYKPSFPLSDFHQEESKGTWRLFIFDEFSLDGGYLTSWGLGISICTPHCSLPESTCGGSDGCGGFCVVESCGLGKRCSPEGVCVCAPYCDAPDMRCGDSDGCGGVCDIQSCPAGSQCIKGKCNIPIYDALDVPIRLDDTQMTLHRSFIDVPPPARPIIDIEVVNLRGEHSNVGVMAVLLLSPQGTLIELMTPRCEAYANFHLSLDDDAAPGAWPCPPTSQLDYQPSNPLAGYHGELHSGRWELMITDGRRGVVGGRLDGWSLRIETCHPLCSARTATCGSPDSCFGRCVVQRGCGPNEVCSPQGQCVCQPDCSNATSCGEPDGCGGMCTIQSCHLSTSQPHWDWMCHKGVCGDGYYEPAGEQLPLFREAEFDMAQILAVFVAAHPKALVRQVYLEDLQGFWAKGAFAFTVVSPSNTSVSVTKAGTCSQRSSFALHFNDRAAGAKQLDCPIALDKSYASLNPLSLFENEPARGTWQLAVHGPPGYLYKFALRVASCRPVCEGPGSCGQPDGCGFTCPCATTVAPQIEATEAILMSQSAVLPAEKEFKWWWALLIALGILLLCCLLCLLLGLGARRRKDRKVKPEASPVKDGHVMLDETDTGTDAHAIENGLPINFADTNGHGKDMEESASLRPVNEENLKTPQNGRLAKKEDSPEAKEFETNSQSSPNQSRPGSGEHLQPPSRPVSKAVSLHPSPNRSPDETTRFHNSPDSANAPSHGHTPDGNTLVPPAAGLDVQENGERTPSVARMDGERTPSVARMEGRENPGSEGRPKWEIDYDAPI